jgi:hypothetical protein
MVSAAVLSEISSAKTGVTETKHRNIREIRIVTFALNAVARHFF